MTNTDTSDTQLDRAAAAIVEELDTTHTALGALVVRRVVEGIEDLGDVEVDPDDVSDAYRAEIESIAATLDSVGSEEIEAAREDSSPDEPRGYW